MRANSRAATNSTGVNAFGVPMLMALALLMAWFALSPAAAHAADSCANAEFRKGTSAQLPDCRAYEQATPVYKGEQDAPLLSPAGSIYDPGVSADGDRAAYFSQGAFAGSPSPNTHYVATRGVSNWSSQGVLPKQSVITGIACIQGAVAYAQDLSRVLIVDGAAQGFFGCGADDPPLVPGEPEGVANLFVRDTDTGTYQLVTPHPVSGNSNDSVFFKGASPDLSHIVFEARMMLTPDAVSGKMLYAWSDGVVHLIGQIPTGPATSCSGTACTTIARAGLGGPREGAGSGVFRVARAVSADGTRIFFHAKPAGGVESLYLRVGDTTTQIDVAQGGSGPSGGGKFMTATADGSSVFFTAESKLTADSTATAGHPDLYRYDVETGDLSDLTVDTADVNGADVRGVVGASEDGSYLYYVANGVLAGNANSQGDVASPGDCTGASTTRALETCNLYVRHDGSTTFIATLAGTDLMVWGINTNGPQGSPWQSRVTPDGQHLAFNSTRSLTGYDSTPVDPTACIDSDADPSPCSEVFVYDVESSQLQCASCNPSGAAPLGPSRIDGDKPSAVFFNGPRSGNFSLPRNLSGHGSRVFFNSRDSLVLEDTNARQDVYAWENGQVHLISTGRHVDDSAFFGASTDGDSAFFITREQLVPQDTDGLFDLYDARVGGGLASQHQPPPPPPCTGDACKGQPTAPPSERPKGSSEYSGPGNQASNAPDCSRAGHKAKRHARKVKKAKRKVKKAKRKVRRAHGKRAKRRARHMKRRARHKLKRSKHRYKRAQRRTRRCERGAK